MLKGSAGRNTAAAPEGTQERENRSSPAARYERMKVRITIAGRARDAGYRVFLTDTAPEPGQELRAWVQRKSDVTLV